MLLEHCEWAGVDIKVQQAVSEISPEQGVNGGPDTYVVQTDKERFRAHKVVLASGGLSLPKIASDLALRVAARYELTVEKTRAGLVPFTYGPQDKAALVELAGIATDVTVNSGPHTFSEALLFTHRGLSGPAILQISSFWQPGQSVTINLLPNLDAAAWLAQMAATTPQKTVAAALRTRLPKRLVDNRAELWGTARKLGSLSGQARTELVQQLTTWAFMPAGTEGYRTAEVTVGGISTDEVSSKTFAIKRMPGLFAIGEALDVTGWLGGYNFQWAWASGWCCAQHLGD